MGSPVVHFQILAQDVEAMSSFYGDVFGWRIEPRRLTSVEAGVSGSYPFVEGEPGGITGGITDAVPDGHGGVVVIEVDDVEATLLRVEQLGGRRRHPEVPPELLTMEGERSFELAEFEDPEGNLVQVIHR
jgi:predicted enzyme related to lactoylglutathione lyase